MENLRISLVQADLKWEDKAANLATFQELSGPLQGCTDVVVLPEMFSTGFSMNTQALAEPMNGPSIAWMKDLAKALNAVVTGSLIITENEQYYNRQIWMAPDGAISIYDKRHLFTLANEQDYYSAGQERVVFTYKGWKIFPQICYDLRFPVWSRNTIDYDLLIYIANFPAKRRHAWNSLLIARAIENQVYTVGVNRIGEDPNGLSYSGDSRLIDYAGETIFHAAHHESVFTTTLSYQKQVHFRSKLQFLPDRDQFDIR